MKDYSDQEIRQKELRSMIVGLGKGSLRKSYFPQLQEQIKALRLAKEKAEENEKKFSLIFDSTSDGILLVSPDNGAVYLCNRTACHMFAYSSEEMTSCMIADLFTESENENDNLLEKLISNSESYRSALRHIPMKTSKGSIIYCDINTSFVEIDANRYLLILFRDVTELARIEKENKEVQARLFQAQKMEAIGTLAGGIAHDFNNILSGIFGYSRLTENCIKENNHKKSLYYVEQIQKSAQKATDLIYQILTFTRMSNPEKHPLKLSLAVKETLKLLRPIIPATIEIKSKIESSARIMADPTKIHQLLMNFCTNAYHAMQEKGGILYVTLKEIDCTFENCIKDLDIKPGKYLELKVQDTGKGMDKSIVEKIFDPYFTTKEEGEGTGLGLAIALVVIEEHNGFIKVDSEPGKGSCFQVYFPVLDKKSPSVVINRKETLQECGTETIMLVDDEETILDVTGRILKKYGYTVVSFIDSSDALDAFKSDPDKFDLVITDMTMPGMEGNKLAAAILKIRPEMPIIICTGYSDRISEEAALSMGIRKYVEKPVITNNLALLIREVLKK
ncbi:Two component protein (Response regulator/sensory box histidine kinase) (fragment) [Desulfamplus magnetovallimortis]|uniref:histidine kinase n=1 Tax=Desulfamplus magnetovallimortis TaxID=1246637 RepID=A0A1W1H7B7_9BACT